MDRSCGWLCDYIQTLFALLQEGEFPGWRSTTVLGLLDIYGFEVFQHNRFVFISVFGF